MMSNTRPYTLTRNRIFGGPGTAVLVLLMVIALLVFSASNLEAAEGYGDPPDVDDEEEVLEILDSSDSENDITPESCAGRGDAGSSTTCGWAGCQQTLVADTELYPWCEGADDGLVLVRAHQRSFTTYPDYHHLDDEWDDGNDAHALISRQYLCGTNHVCRGWHVEHFAYAPSYVLVWDGTSTAGL